MIVECDEDCHRHLERACEISRITELMEQAGALPLILIRFNPRARALPQLTRELLKAFTVDLEEKMFHCKFVAYDFTALYDPVVEIAKLARARAREGAANPAAEDDNHRELATPTHKKERAHRKSPVHHTPAPLVLEEEEEEEAMRKRVRYSYTDDDDM